MKVRIQGGSKRDSLDSLGEAQRAGGDSDTWS